MVQIKNNNHYNTTSKIPRLFFDKGTICIKNSKLIRIPRTKFDEQDNETLRAFGFDYNEISEYMNTSELDFVDQVANYLPSPIFEINDLLELRDYQENAIDKWMASSMRGCVVLPTGAGKTAVGIKAIEKVNAATLVIVPTIDLMEQWAVNISKYFKKNKNENVKNNIERHVGYLGEEEKTFRQLR